MPQISHYSDEQVGQLLAGLFNILEKHKAPTGPSLMVLDNMVTNLINTSVVPTQRQAIVSSLARALQSSINESKTRQGKQVIGCGNSLSALP